MKSRLPSRVLLMPEYGVDLPLWDRSPQGFGEIGEDDLAISDQLASRLRNWNAQWADHPPEKPRPWSAIEENLWIEGGYRLAWQLQSELTDIEVLIKDDKGVEVPISERW